MADKDRESDKLGDNRDGASQKSEFKDGIDDEGANEDHKKKNRMHARVDSENVSDSNEYFQKVKTVEILTSFWGLLQIGNSIIIWEVLNDGTDNKDNFL